MKKKLFKVGLDIYKAVSKPANAAEMNWLGPFGPILELDEIVDLISLYSLVNPVLCNFHTIRKNEWEAEDTITYQKNYMQSK